MSNLKCRKCGLVNPFGAEGCRRCGSALFEEDFPAEEELAWAPQNAARMEAEAKAETGGAWGIVQTLIILSVAGSITGYLGLYIREYLPAGTYPNIVLIAIFLPAAVVGLIAAMIILYVVELMFRPGKKAAG